MDTVIKVVPLSVKELLDVALNELQENLTRLEQTGHDIVVLIAEQRVLMARIKRLVIEYEAEQLTH